MAYTVAFIIHLFIERDLDAYERDVFLCAKREPIRFENNIASTFAVGVLRQQRQQQKCRRCCLKNSWNGSLFASSGEKHRTPWIGLARLAVDRADQGPGVHEK